MEGMIQNILDFTRCQMKLGIELHMEEKVEGLEKVLDQVIREMKITSPDRRIRFEVSLESPVTCDPVRIAQLLSNLLGFAEAQAIPETAFKIELNSKDEDFCLSVKYMGDRIPQKALPQLFDPFHQEDAALKKGVGLGLYIASEISKAHKGSIEVDSTKRKTCFTFRMKC